MKKMFLLIAVLCLAGFLLSGCGEKTTVTEPKSNVQDSPAVQETVPSANPQPSTTASGPDISELRQEGLNCLEEATRVCLPVNFANAEPGETVGFAFGLSNQFATDKKFAINVKFVRTQQKFGEVSITADKDYMKSWAAVNDLETYYELEPNEKLSKPILIKVQELIGDDKPVEDGAYVFEIQAQTFENGFYEDYGGAQEITVRVNK